MSEERAVAALEAAGIAYSLTRHGPVESLAAAAETRGVPPSAIIKTLVVRRAANDYLFALVPGGRSISWHKLRALLGVNRLSMPDAGSAREVTGYERGTITPFGATTAWPVVADVTIEGLVSIGAGDHGVAATVEAADLLTSLDAEVADISDPE